MTGPGTPALPSCLVEFAARWNRHEFWESHEALEGPWRETRSRFYHGLILLASAYVHVERENPHGIRAQLGKGLRALDPFRPRYLGVDVEHLVQAAEEARAAVAGSKEAETPDRWRELLPFPSLDLRSELIRGDEVELQPAGDRPEPDQKSRNRM